jgi:hypothetical protein
MDRCFNNLSFQKIHFPRATDYSALLRDNRPFITVLVLAAAMNIYALSFPMSISYDEPTHLMAGLGLYVYIQDFWRRLSNIPIHIIVPGFLTALIVLLIFYKYRAGHSKRFHWAVSIVDLYDTKKPLFIMVLVTSLALYFLLVHGLPYHPDLVRFPPIGKLLYLVSYLTTGINFIGPRAVQLICYLFGSIYLYKSISLFRDKMTALLGSSIFLFSPLVFYYAHRGELASGNLFFIILISYLFIMFIRDVNDAYLVLCSLVISIGFLYKRTVLLMFFICLFYLIIYKVRNRNFNLKLHLLVLSISLVPVIPWLVIGKFYVWRKYEIVWSHLFSLDHLAAYFSIIPYQFSWVIFFLFVLSIIIVLMFRRDHLTLFYGFVFLSYYLFFTADIYGITFFRFSLTLQATIAIYLSLFISYIISKINMRYSFQLVYAALICFLILLCTIWQVSPLDARLVTYKNTAQRYFPVSDSMRWIRDNVRDGEKILILQVAPASLYRVKYGIARDKIVSFWYVLEEVSTPQKLRAYCKTNNISYIVFSHGPANRIPHNRAIIDYLRTNRHHEFAPAAEFNLDGNYINIYKLDGT